MKTLFVSLLLALALVISVDAIAQEPEMKSQLVINASLGSLSDQYGFDGIEGSLPQEYQLVSCFTVTADGIYVFDRVKQDIKCYTLQGNYVKTIPAAWNSGRITAVDMVVQQEKIYLLVDFPVAPQDKDIEFTRFQLFTYDMSGDFLSRDFIPISNLGQANINARPTSRKVYSRNAVKLTADNGGISILDRNLQTAHLLVSHGQKVTPEQMIASVSGQRLDQNLVRLDRSRGRVEILNASGGVIKTMPKGHVAAKASDSGYFALKSCVQEAGKKMRFEVAVYDANGQRQGFFVSPFRTWQPFFPTFQYYSQFATDVYELHAGKDGVRVFKWSL